VQALAKQIFGGAFPHFVFVGIVGEDGRAGKAKELALVEIADNAIMNGAKLRPVALIKYEDDLLIF